MNKQYRTISVVLKCCQSPCNLAVSFDQVADDITLDAGWACDFCTIINLPYRRGCDCLQGVRPENYVIPDGYVPTAEEVALIQEREEADEQTAVRSLLCTETRRLVEIIHTCI